MDETIESLKARLAALESAAKAEPVAWRWKGIDDDWRYSVHKLDESAEPLYTAPAAIDNGGGRDAQDARRYRWLRDKGLDYIEWQKLKCIEDDAEFAAYIDTALSKKAGE